MDKLIYEAGTFKLHLKKALPTQNITEPLANYHAITANSVGILHLSEKCINDAKIKKGDFLGHIKSLGLDNKIFSPFSGIIKK